MILPTDTFSTVLSLRAFLVDTLTAVCGAELPLFINPILLPHEREEIATLSHYLRVEITRGETDYLQPIDLTFRLWATVEFDPSCLWLYQMSSRITDAILTTKTDPANNTVTIADYDAVIGLTAITEFFHTGTLPANLAAIALLRFPAVPAYLRGGQHIGLTLLPGIGSPRLDLQTVPMSLTWKLVARYFEPAHLKGVLP